MKNYLKEIFGTQQLIQKELDHYFDDLKVISFVMREAIAAHLSEDLEKFLALFQHINELEHRMDTLRRNIETLIYGRSLLPDTRGDILGLLENVDKIPNRIQSMTREIKLQKIVVPENLHEILKKLADQGVGIVEELVLAMKAFLNNPHDVQEIVKNLSREEHEGDLIEHQAVALTFDNSCLELAHKMQLRYLIDRLGSICDIAEDVGDRVMISALKRLL